LKKKVQRAKEDKKKYNKFKVKKTKAKAKANAKTLKKVKKMYSKMDKPPTSYKEQAEYLKKQYDILETKFNDLAFKTMRVEKGKYDNLEKKIYDLSINIEGEHDSIDTKIDRLTDKVSAFEKRFADSRVAEHMWYLESILKYCAENKKFLYDADARGKTFLQEIEGEMKSRGIGIDPNIHKQVLDEMADDIKDERDEQDKKRDQV